MTIKKLLFLTLIFGSIANNVLSMKRNFFSKDYVVNKETSWTGASYFTPVCPAKFLTYKNLSSAKKNQERKKAIQSKKDKGSVICSNMPIEITGTNDPFDCDRLYDQFKDSIIDYGKKIIDDAKTYTVVDPSNDYPNLGIQPFKSNLNLVVDSDLLNRKDQKILENRYPLNINTNKYGYPYKPSMSPFLQIPLDKDEEQWKKNYINKEMENFKKDYRAASNREGNDTGKYPKGDIATRIFENDLYEAINKNYITQRKNNLSENTNTAIDVVEVDKYNTFTRYDETSQQDQSKHGYSLPIINECPEENAIIIGDNKKNDKICQQYTIFREECKRREKNMNDAIYFNTI